eukprot:CAMPEP_0197070312 /NCGR_PEP_ID=MMETSP1384-20130603/199110_1 /TAXON_ID=29189 /ORGANISM="Ammonia sp." /LENGTH=91 /DNA_ID=CAMNT_0042508643 /DNA_START=21 /DNA_END=292 /DNA_ORIENTATION=+
MATASDSKQTANAPRTYEDWEQLPMKDRAPEAILPHLPHKKFKQPSGTKPACVIVACGSFSPPTHLHLRLMEDARDRLCTEYEIVAGILSP